MGHLHRCCARKYHAGKSAYTSPSNDSETVNRLQASSSRMIGALAGHIPLGSGVWGACSLEPPPPQGQTNRERARDPEYTQTYAHQSGLRALQKSVVTGTRHAD
eukprot:6203280-Pleurochrysis_carterae.AAC.1